VKDWTWQGYVAGVLAFWAVTVNNITFATNDYFWIIVQALVGAGLSNLILAVSFPWRRVGIGERVFATLVLALNAWTLLDAGGRRLPAHLGVVTEARRPTRSTILSCGLPAA
jgi:hypothetical protein